MTITAKIIADSAHPDCGTRLTTMELRYPRFIHAEFMTHRMFSRNASSSRAIPVSRLIQDVIDDTAMPSHWGKNQPGMQAREEHNEPVDIPVTEVNTDLDCKVRIVSTHDPREAWNHARDKAVEIAKAFSDAGYHKQIVNRLLEPFSHINVVVTATDWANFFLLRDHPDAQPEIMLLAQAMKAAMDGSTPKVTHDHLPYVDSEDGQASRWDTRLLYKVSAARCARVSYKTHDGRRPEFSEDLELFQRLCGSDPKHLSPLEHPSTAMTSRGRIANFRDWRQFRKDYE